MMTDTTHSPIALPSRRERWAAVLRREMADLFDRGWYLLVVGAVLLCLHQVFGWSYVSHLSLPYPLWVHTKFSPTTIERGDYVVVNLPPEVSRIFPPGAAFIKEVVGVPGDVVQAQDRVFTVIPATPGQEAVQIGKAKVVSRKGLSLMAGPVGVIPPGRYFVRGTHPDSLDSRYAMLGWVSDRDIVGSAIPILPAAAARLWVYLGWSQE